MYKMLEENARIEDIARNAEGVRGKETALRLSWLLLRASSAIHSLFSSGSPPPTDAIAALEAFLADIGVEALLYAKRGLIDEREAKELIAILSSNELLSALGDCKRGVCKPVKLREIGLRLWALGVALQVGSKRPLRACIQA